MQQPASSTQATERYTNLCDRAVAFIEEQGGTVHEDVLIGHVFGSTGSAAIWRPLLRNVLEPDERVLFRANGEWFLPTVPSSLPPDHRLLPDFVAIDVETTGLQAHRHRIIEVALLRYRDGVLARRYETLLNPGRNVPVFITKLTTIRNEDVADAPAFADIAQDVLDFVGSDIIVGHNVAFDISFLNTELDRVSMPKLVNDRIDTMGLATRLLKEIRKPSLDRIASMVGLNPRGVHRAGGDAKLTAEVAMRLMSKPGVYIMRDVRGEIVYVGKAKNLRNRVNSYYSQPIGITRKMDGLIENVTRIDHQVVGSEIEALLLESQLIHRYQPRYNVALKKSEHYPYIKVDTSNPWPRVSLVRRRQDDHARYYGPYTSATSARRTVDVINGALPLRTCTRTFRNAKSYGRPCMLLDLGQCLGPCTGKADRDAYQGHVKAVLDLLEGRDDGMYRQLHTQLEEAAEALDFERADRIRKNILNLTAILGEQQRTRDAESLLNLALVLPGVTTEREVWLMLHGVLWARLAVDDDLEARLAASLARAQGWTPPPRNHDDVDEVGMLTRFLFRNADNPALVMFRPEVANAAEIAAQVLAVEDTDIAALDVKKVISAEENCESDRPDVDTDADT